MSEPSEVIAYVCKFCAAAGVVCAAAVVLGLFVFQRRLRAFVQGGGESDAKESVRQAAFYVGWLTVPVGAFWGAALVVFLTWRGAS